MGWRCGFLAALIWLFFGTAGLCVEEATFPVTCEVGGRRLELFGIGRLSRWLITGCDIALYLPPGAKDARELNDVARRLHFHYYRSIKGSQFAHGALDTLERAFAPRELAGVRGGIEILHAAYRDVERGDEYTLTYEPDEGVTTLALNGQVLVAVPGADFARIYFAVWLGDPPIDERLKAGLMRRRDVRGLPPDARLGVSE